MIKNSPPAPREIDKNWEELKNGLLNISSDEGFRPEVKDKMEGPKNLTGQGFTSFLKFSKN